MYRKEFYVFDGDKPVPARIRNYEKKDFQTLLKIQHECFPPPFPAELLWTEEQLQNHITLFPEGALCVEVNGEIAGSMTGLIVDFQDSDPDHSWEEITDGGSITNHKRNGNTLYVVDIGVRPAFRKYGLGKSLMFSMYEVVVHLGLERLLGGGRMAGYHKLSDDLSAKEYLDRVMKGDLKDPVITFLLRCGRIPVRVVENYLDDEESCNYAALMEWRNPFFAQKPK